ncbi:MAG: hypothetical protein U9P70_04135 [Patescibacteria group bacterium]|nr:hypothetical protein [Patescibacteria group bacterium]
MTTTTTEGTEKVVIVAHGDFDGIASAVLLAERLGIFAEDLHSTILG